MNSRFMIALKISTATHTHTHTLTKTINFDWLSYDIGGLTGFSQQNDKNKSKNILCGGYQVKSNSDEWLLVVHSVNLCVFLKQCFMD